MKHYAMMLFGVIFCAPLFSFSGRFGGDVFAVFLNGKQVHLQAIHADKSVKTLRLPRGSEGDRIEVFYSHCGQPGKNRVLTLRNGKNNLIQKLTFGDGQTDRSRMGFTRKDLGANKTAQLHLYYSSVEMPQETLLTIIDWQGDKAVARY